jgi:hypothetical protein
VNVPAVHLQRGASLETGAVHLTRAPAIKQTPAERARVYNAARARLAAWPRWLRCGGGPALWRRKRCSRACARRRGPAQALAVRRGLRQSTIRRPRHEASGSAKCGYVLEQAANLELRAVRKIWLRINQYTHVYHMSKISGGRLSSIFSRGVVDGTAGQAGYSTRRRRGPASP